MGIHINISLDKNIEYFIGKTLCIRIYKRVLHLMTPGLYRCQVNTRQGSISHVSEKYTRIVGKTQGSASALSPKYTIPTRQFWDRRR